MQGVDERAELAELLDEVRRIEVMSRHLVTDVMSGGYHSVFRGAGIEIEDVREYADGDDIRAVDWNVTARVGRPFVRRYADERELSVLFLLDVSGSMAGGFGPLSARGVAARACACLALSAVRNEDKTGLVAFSSGVDGWVPPRKGLPHALRIVRDCLAVRGSGDRTDPGPALEFALRAVRRHAVVFLVSDFLGEGRPDLLARCARRHDVVAVRLLLPEEAALADGPVRARDPETGRERIVDFGSARVRAAWEDGLRRQRARTEEECRRAGVDLMDIPVPRVRGKDTVSGPILRFFRMRELRGAKR